MQHYRPDWRPMREKCDGHRLPVHDLRNRADDTDAVCPLVQAKKPRRQFQQHRSPFRLLPANCLGRAIPFGVPIHLRQTFDCLDRQTQKSPEWRGGVLSAQLWAADNMIDALVKQAPSQLAGLVEAGLVKRRVVRPRGVPFVGHSVSNEKELFHGLWWVSFHTVADYVTHAKIDA